MGYLYIDFFSPKPRGQHQIPKHLTHLPSLNNKLAIHLLNVAVFQICAIPLHIYVTPTLLLGLKIYMVCSISITSCRSQEGLGIKPARSSECTKHTVFLIY